jgi:hypothetical protein
VPPPTRKIACRLCVTYAGFEGESVLLEELCKRGLAQPEVSPGLFAGDGLLMFWSHEPIAPWQTTQWIEQLPAERRFLKYAFKTDRSGKLLYPEQLFSCPKKSGKTAFAALHVLTTTLLFGGAYPEATLCANDYDQAQGRVFEM